MVRTIERTFQRAAQSAGPFYSVGYTTYIRGLDEADLFAPQSGSDPLDETNACFTHREDGSVVRVFPTAPSTVGGVVLTARKNEDYTLQVVHSRATHDLYYSAQPNRSWHDVGSFTTDTKVATWTLVETDVIDVTGHVGTGTAEVELTWSQPITLRSGRRFSYADLGSRLVADFQFQLVTQARSTDPQYPVLVNDGGIWRQQRP